MEDLDVRAGGPTGVRVGHAVGAANRLPHVRADAGRAHVAAAAVRDVDAGAPRAAAVAVGHAVDPTHGAADVRAVVAALAASAVRDLDAGTARLAGIAIGLAVHAADRRVDVEALAAAAGPLVVHLGAVAVSVGRSARVGHAVGAADRIVLDTEHLARGLAPGRGRVADLVTTTVLVVAALLVLALPSVVDLDAGAARLAGVAIAAAVHPADRQVDVRAQAGLGTAQPWLDAGDDRPLLERHVELLVQVLGAGGPGGQAEGGDDQEQDEEVGKDSAARHGALLKGVGFAWERFPRNRS